MYWHWRQGKKELGRKEVWYVSTTIVAQWHTNEKYQITSYYILEVYAEPRWKSFGGGACEGQEVILRKEDVVYSEALKTRKFL